MTPWGKYLETVRMTIAECLLRFAYRAATNSREGKCLKRNIERYLSERWGV